MAENEFTYKAVKDETMARKEMPNNLRKKAAWLKRIGLCLWGLVLITALGGLAECPGSLPGACGGPV